MSETPRTDTALVGESGGLWDGRRIENFIAFARSLERDLAAKTAECERLRVLLRDLLSDAQHGTKVSFHGDRYLEICAALDKKQTTDFYGQPIKEIGL